MMPQRIQISRVKGWRMPPDTVKVDRSTKWGNPYRSDQPTEATARCGAMSAAEAFDLWLSGHPALQGDHPERRARILADIGELHGKNLACWCGPRDICHADVLLRLARDAKPTAPVDRVPSGLPRLALSVRQPWAYAIIHLGKDIENRTWQAVNHGLRQRGRIAIHASKGMTKDEYDDTRDTFESMGLTCPPAADLHRGGIIGSVEVIDVVTTSKSPWFCGPRGLVLRNPQPCAFIPAQGALGYFEWQPGDTSIVPPPAKWMLPKTEQPKLEVQSAPVQAQGTLL